jgi:GT2 family glycosyltransferase
MLKTAVVILNYNGKAFLEQFLPSVCLNCPSGSVFIIDNHSTDNSINFLECNYPQIEIIRLPANFGFAGGYNQGLAQIEAENFALINSDVELTTNWLSPLEQILDSNPNVAAVQPKILDFNNKSKFEYAGAAGGFLDVLGYPFCRGRIFDEVETDQKQYEQTNPIFWATGACFFVRSKVFNDLRGFDARFFAHMEEIDLCWRIQNKGFEILYTPESTVYHVGGGTLHKSNPFKTYLNFRNNLAMLFKNLPFVWLVPILFARMILDGISSLKFLKAGEYANIWAIIKAHFGFYKMIPYLIQKRNGSFLGFKKLHKMSIVWDYFVKGKKTFNQL